MKRFLGLRQIYFIVLSVSFFFSFHILAGDYFAYADWQATLELYFEIVDTFDNLQDWSGGTGYHWDLETMPKKLDGSNSIWTFYSNDTSAVDDWIKDHGPNYIWGSSGKSLCINYNNMAGGVDGYGPSRLGTFFGDGVTGKSGYKKIHLFFMIKFHPDFFSLKQGTIDEFEWVGTMKFFDVCSGFTEVGYWGNATEHSQACALDQTRQEYGLNFGIINVYGGGSSHLKELFLIDYLRTAKFDGSCWTYDNLPGHNLKDGSNGTFQDIYLSNEWMGLELAVDIGSLGSSDGSVELWIYNSSGTVVGHYIRSDVNRLVQFDHYYNKVVLGGNRLGSDYGKDPGDSDENRFYVDDFIINGSRIGPTYFEILNPPPSAPVGLRIVP